MTTLPRHLARHRAYLNTATYRLYCTCNDWAAVLTDGDTPAAYAAHDDHVAETWTHTTLVRSRDELTTLPAGTLIESGEYLLRNRHFLGWWQRELHTSGTTTKPRDVDVDDIELPARIVWTPHPSSATIEPRADYTQAQ